MILRDKNQLPLTFNTKLMARRKKATAKIATVNEEEKEVKSTGELKVEDTKTEEKEVQPTEESKVEDTKTEDSKAEDNCKEEDCEAENPKNCDKKDCKSKVCEGEECVINKPDPINQPNKPKGDINHIWPTQTR